MMKKILYILFVCLFVSTGRASYTYEIYTYGGSKNLSGTESILIDQQGGMPTLILESQSSAVIKGTSNLALGSGGVWQMSILGNSSLDMSGGQVQEISIGNGEATAFLTGGLIQRIRSYQSTFSGPHITIVYSGDLPTLNTSNVLSGLWGNGDPFSIQLVNVSGYSPAIDNIRFELIPEPATLALLALGGLLIRRKNR